MIDKNNIQDDVLQDEISALLGKIRSLDTYDSTKKALIKELELLAAAKGYIRFPGHYLRYHLERLGESYLYEVPANKRGYLKPFAGKTVRIMCVGHKRFYRWLLCGEVCLQ